MRVVTPRLYFRKSAKWIKRIEFSQHDKSGIWRLRGYHNYPGLNNGTTRVDSTTRQIQPSPREGGERVARSGMRSLALLAQTTALTMKPLPDKWISLRTVLFCAGREVPHPPFGHLLPAFAGRRPDLVRS